MTEMLSVAGTPIAVERRAGRAPGLFWLSGFRSDMTGSKAEAVDRFAAEHGLAMTRFDYSGHGRSGGDFNAGTISRWLEEAEAVYATTVGPQVIIGSSMGGWIALLLVRALRRAGRTPPTGLVLIAPATDMTETLMRPQFGPRELGQLETQGYVERPSDYSDVPYRLTRELIEDGSRHLLFGRAIETGCPLTILQGARDRDVPKEHALRLVQHLLSDPVTLTLVPDGEHRLSRPQDLALLEAALERMIGDVATAPGGA